MKHLSIGPRQVFRDHPGYGRALSINVGVLLAFGLTLVLDDPQRFSAPAFAAVRSTGINGWGLALIVTALGLAVAPLLGTKATRTAMTVAGAVCFLLAGWFLSAYLYDDHASLWGTIWFVGQGFWLGSQSIAQRDLRTEPVDT